jgi:hypothetical protein
VSIHQIISVIGQSAPVAEKAIDWSAWVTAASSVVLTLATIVLAWFTWMLFSATRSPSVVATIESNPRSMMHLDLHVENEGTSAAFEIELRFDPLMPVRDGLAHGPPPLSNISVLRAGQKVSTFLDDYATLSVQPYKVTIGWRAKPGGRLQQTSYSINLKQMEGINRLGDDPLVQLAEELKKIREDWRQIASGSKRIEIDAYTEYDRLRERRARDRWLRRQRARDAKVVAAHLERQADTNDPLAET